VRVAFKFLFVFPLGLTISKQQVTTDKFDNSLLDTGDARLMAFVKVAHVLCPTTG